MLDDVLKNRDGYVPVLFQGAISGKLHAKEALLLDTEEWRLLGVRHPFVSYEQLEEYVCLRENNELVNRIATEEKISLDKLVRAYIAWLIEEENKLLANNPSYWLEPSFYPSGVFAEDGDLDVYNKYDKLPINGFARSALYFFIAQTAKNHIRKALQEKDLLTAAKSTIEKCKKIFEDNYNIQINHNAFRHLSDIYLADAFRQMEVNNASTITLDKEDIWQNVYDEEKQAYRLFEENMDKFRLYGFRTLLDIQHDLIVRLEKEHPYFSHGKIRINQNALPPKGKYELLAEWLETEKRNGRDHVNDAGGVKALADSENFRRLIGWEEINDNSLRTALRRKKSKK